MHGSRRAEEPSTGSPAAICCWRGSGVHGPGPRPCPHSLDSSSVWSTADGTGLLAFGGNCALWALGLWVSHRARQLPSSASLHSAAKANLGLTPRLACWRIRRRKSSYLSIIRRPAFPTRCRSWASGRENGPKVVLPTSSGRKGSYLGRRLG